MLFGQRLRWRLLSTVHCTRRRVLAGHSNEQCQKLDFFFWSFFSCVWSRDLAACPTGSYTQMTCAITTTQSYISDSAPSPVLPPGSLALLLLPHPFNGNRETLTQQQKSQFTCLLQAWSPYHNIYGVAMLAMLDFPITLACICCCCGTLKTQDRQTTATDINVQSH